MLQQTQVATVLPYYDRWMRRFPTVEALAQAEEDEALAHWQGLGYYSRCRNLLTGARWVMNHGFPRTRSEWRGLPGIGDYSAGALASIVNGEPSAAIDGNVERVYARFAASTEPKGRLNARARAWSERHMASSGATPADWNQALMELGATICAPRNPSCGLCPLEAFCEGKGDPETYPVRPPSRPVVELEFTVAVPLDQGRFGVRRIGQGGWWAGLWEFPSTRDAESPGGRHLCDVRHQVTHHRLKFSAYLVESPPWPDGLEWLSLGELDRRAMPSPQRKIARIAREAMKEVVAANGLEPLT